MQTNQVQAHFLNTGVQPPPRLRSGPQVHFLDTGKSRIGVLVGQPTETFFFKQNHTKSRVISVPPLQATSQLVIIYLNLVFSKLSTPPNKIFSTGFFLIFRAILSLPIVRLSGRKLIFHVCPPGYCPSRLYLPTRLYHQLESPQTHQFVLPKYSCHSAAKLGQKPKVAVF